MARTHPKKNMFSEHIRKKFRSSYGEANWGIWWLVIVLMLGVITWRAYFPPNQAVLDARAPMMRAAAQESKNVLDTFFQMVEDTKERIDDVEIEVIWPTPAPTGTPESSKDWSPLYSSLFYQLAMVLLLYYTHGQMTKKLTPEQIDLFALSSDDENILSSVFGLSNQPKEDTPPRNTSSHASSKKPLVKTGEEALGNTSESVLSVGTFLSQINTMLESVRVSIRGEISSVDTRGKAVYFTLSDPKEKATLSCLIWVNKLQSMGLELKEGMDVVIVGSPSIYKPFGKFSVNADYISPVGEGALKQAFEALKRKLEEQGYFSQHRKRALPSYPKNIGLITSEFGDARKDFITHLGSHGFSIFFKDVRVEGVQSIDSIVTAIQWFNSHAPQVEVLVLTRGGGSLESLHAFNSREVAEAIFASRIPVISAVGHENDISIADMVADVRASTPTHAGKLLSEYWNRAPEYITQLEQTIISRFTQSAQGIENKIALFEQNIIHLFKRQLQRYSDNLTTYEQMLHLADPETKLKQGYSITYTSNGAIITDSSQVTEGTRIKTTLAKGSVISVVS